MDFSSYKTWQRIIIAVLALGAIIYFVIPAQDNTSISKEQQLLEKGKEYILRQVNSPSTTTFLSYNDKVEGLLREWGVTLEEMTELIGEIVVDDAVLNQLQEGAVAASPGMKYKHYAPTADITLIKSDFETFKNLCEGEDNITAFCFDGEEKLLSCPSVTYGKESDGFSQSARLFDALRELDEMGAEKVYARCPDTKGMGMAVYNRLIRSAGFKIKVI